jgi:hypothetical protein
VSVHQARRVRLDLVAIDDALGQVEQSWPRIEAGLRDLGIGHKDPFSASIRDNMRLAFAHLDELLALEIEPFTDQGMDQMLMLNNIVHYGLDPTLMAQFAMAIEATIDKFNTGIDVLARWHARHTARGDPALKLAAETYVSILGQPQLFVEGNHRTGSLIASWINLRAECPPFVLTPTNAIAYFAPSAEIKRFGDQSTWRGRRRLPKYRKVFGEFWAAHVDARFVVLNQ